MAKRRGFLDLLDGRPLVRGSRFRFGGVRARGVPAILCGAAAIVLAARAGAALNRGIVALPETIREVRLLLVALRGERRELLP
jgi:hypothetical protein